MSMGAKGLRAFFPAQSLMRSLYVCTTCVRRRSDAAERGDWRQAVVLSPPSASGAHPLGAPVVLRVPGSDELMLDPQAHPPHGEATETVQPGQLGADAAQRFARRQVSRVGVGDEARTERLPNSIGSGRAR